MLSVIYEIKKFKISNRRKAILKEKLIIGDYLICFHNLSHFQKKAQSLETHLKENQEIKDKIIEISSELQKNVNEKFITQNKNFEKLQEKIKKLTKNLKKKMVNLKKKLACLKTNCRNLKKKITKHSM